MMMDLKSRILIGGMVKAKIMYYSFFPMSFKYGVDDRLVCLGELVHGFEASLQRSQRSIEL